MKDLGYILGAPAWNAPVVVKPDAVYVNTNITREDTEDGTEQYRFHCVQYTPEEYTEMMAEELTNTQVALAEVYEMMLGGE